jgi:hypothetical protein
MKKMNNANHGIHVACTANNAMPNIVIEFEGKF